MFITAPELTNKKTVPRLAPQFDMEIHHDPAAPFLARNKKHRSTELVTLFSHNKGQMTWTVPLTILLDPFSWKTNKQKTKIQPYLMRGEGHKDANATWQGGVHQRLGASRNERGLLQRQDCFSYVVVHNYISLKQTNSVRMWFLTGH